MSRWLLCTGDAAKLALDVEGRAEDGRTEDALDLHRPDPLLAWNFTTICPFYVENDRCHIKIY